jgi:nucleotide-binding universal stress UspA family protein
MTAIKTILHPTDFSDLADQAFRLACALARDYGAKLLLLHVRPAPIAPSGVMTMEPEPPDPREFARAQLDRMLPEGLSVPCERHLRVGNEAEEIARLADEAACDLIVMGTHGRTGLGRMLMGSVAEKVVRQAPCPVLTIKQPAKAARPVAKPVQPVGAMVGLS